MSIDDLEMLFGVVLITIYAYERFNTPSNVRSSTTASRYMVSVFLYILIYLITFKIFTSYPELVKSLKTALGTHEPASIAGATTSDYSTTIFVAMVFSLLVPKIPFISQLDAKLRVFLHKLASIPFEAIRLSKEIQDMEFVIPESHWPKVEDKLQTLGINEQEIKQESSDSLVNKSINILSLMLMLEEWKKDSRFSSFLHENATKLAQLDDHYSRFQTILTNYISMNNKIADHNADQILQEALEKYNSTLQQEKNSLLSEICDLISHGLLTCCLTLGNRKKILSELGFQEPVENTSYISRTINQTLVLFSLLLILVLLTFILFKPEQENIEQLLIRVIMIVSIYCAAVVCALFPKQIWPLFKYTEQSSYPALGYLLSGLMAAASSITISLTFKTLLYSLNKDIHGFSAPVSIAWSSFTNSSYPWTLMSFVSAILIAFLADWKLNKSRNATIRRVVDAFIQSVIMMLTVTLVHWWLTDIAAEHIPPYEKLLIMSAVIGTVIGFIVPEWYRQSWCKEKHQIEPDLKNQENIVELRKVNA